MKSKPKILSPYKRKIVVEGQEWTWQVQGKVSNSLAILICDPARVNKYKIMVSQSVSLDCGDCGVCLSCMGFDYVRPITPKKIERLIKEHKDDNFKKIDKSHIGAV